MSEEAAAVGKETDKSAKEFSLSDFFVAKVEPIQCKSKKSKKTLQRRIKKDLTFMFLSNVDSLFNLLLIIMEYL